MKTLVFATHNEHKVEEIRSLTAGNWYIISLDDLGFTKDISEPFDTLEANARQKSETIYKECGKNCFSEDTGLEVYALKNAPGVLSARYAGSQRSSEDNIALLLENLKDAEDRSAQFRTVISFILDGKETQFEGVCKGKITRERVGVSGFGYDPVFIPDGSNRTFAEMSMEEKSKYSHRAKTFKKFTTYLKTLK